MPKLLTIPKPIEDIKCPHCFEYVNILYCKNCYNFLIFPLFFSNLNYIENHNYESS